MMKMLLRLTPVMVLALSFVGADAAALAAEPAAAPMPQPAQGVGAVMGDARTALAEGRYLDAGKLFDLACRMTGRASIHCDAARAYEQGGHFTGALERYTACARSPEVPEAQRNYAVAAARLICEAPGAPSECSQAAPPAAVAPPPSAEPGCANDRDCKGDRICERGVCVNPQAPAPAPRPAPADPWEEEPPVADVLEPIGHVHDGFFLRLSVGLGYETLSLEQQFAGDITIGGVGAGGSFAIGGSVAENFSLNADFFAAVVVDPSVTHRGVDLGEAQNSSVSLSGLGAGFTFYFMPVNLYLAASFGVGFLTLSVEGDDYESDPGFAVNVMVGQEFWVGNEWGVGIAGQVVYCGVPRQDIDATAPFLGFNLLFSATFN